MGPDLDLQDLGTIGPMAGGATPVGLPEDHEPLLDRKVLMEGSSRARHPFLVTLGVTFPWCLPDFRSLGSLLRLFAVDLFLEVAGLGLERFVFIPDLEEKLPSMLGLKLPIDGVLLGRGRQISKGACNMRTGLAGFGKKTPVRIYFLEVKAGFDVSRNQSKRTHSFMIPQPENGVQYP